MDHGATVKKLRWRDDSLREPFMHHQMVPQKCLRITKDPKGKYFCPTCYSQKMGITNDD